MEIERRWLVTEQNDRDLFRLDQIVCTKIIRLGDDSFVRFRDCNGTYTMTFKTGHGMSRHEYQIEIESEDFDKVNAPIHEMDCGYGPAGLEAKFIKEANLFIVEQEFDTVEEAEEYTVPGHWKEVTNDLYYEYINLYEMYSK